MTSDQILARPQLDREAGSFSGEPPAPTHLQDEQEPPSLYAEAELYDAIVQPGPCEAFYRDEARRRGGPVLELACGTGRLTVPIARDGHDVVGLDASEAMLTAAAHKATENAL